MNNSIQTLN